MSKSRLAIIASHPVQYQAPLFRRLIEEVGGCVYYGHLPDERMQGEGFGVSFHWDLPLLDGYEHRVFAQGLADGIHLRAAVKSFRELRAMLEAQRPDAILCTGWYHPSLFVGLAAARLSGAPCLLRCESNLLRLRGAGSRLFQRLMLSQYAAVLPIGKMNRRYYRHFGVPEDKMISAPYFVDNERFAAAAAQADRSSLRDRWAISKDAFCFVFSGKLEEKKHPESIIQALVGIPAAHLLIVGAGPLESTLRSAAAGLGVSCSFTGFLNQTEIPGAYAAADCLVLPSDSGETWGLVVNEAMACGLPAVVSDRVGCRDDLIVEGKTGHSFPFGNVTALAARLRHFAESPESAHAAGREAVRHIANFSIETASGGILAALQNLTCRKGALPCVA